MNRTEELAKQSDIKGQAYSPSSVLSLFEGMRAQVERTLLFLKSVRSAAVYVREAGDETPRLLFRASMDTQVNNNITAFPRATDHARKYMYVPNQSAI
jgi:hypothetical protein